MSRSHGEYRETNIFILCSIQSLGLKQHVNVPTHVSGHTLDLMITREHDPVISSVPVADRYLEAHASVLCTLHSAKPDCVAKIIRYRQLRAIDFDALRQEVEKSELCTREYSDLNELTSSYNSTLTSLLDKHAHAACRRSIKSIS